MPRRGPKTWTTPEEEVFLQSQLPAYIACQATKVYHNFWNTMGHKFLSRWLESERLTDIPQDVELSDIQKSHVAQAILKRQSALKNWFRWRTNVAHLARSGGPGGVLRLDTTLAGGDEMRGTRAPQEVEVYSHLHYEDRVKADADALIASETVTSRGDKLLMRRIVTCDKYAKEPEEIKAEVRRRHQVALEKWRQTRELNKAGIVEEVDDETKTKAFLELAGHLNCVFRHLSHKTGGLKFTCITGGRNPVTGEAVVLDFHLGDAAEGVDFSAHYLKFADVRAAYATFMNEALAHDDNMEVLARADDLSDRRDDSEAEGRDSEDIQDSEDKAEDDGDVRSDEEESQNVFYNVAQRAENATSDLTTSSELMYTFDHSFMDDMPAVPSVPSTPIHNTHRNHNNFEYPQVPTAFSAADLAKFDRLLTAVTQQDLDALDFPPLAPQPDASSFSSGPGSELDDFSFPSTATSEGSGCDFNFSFTDIDFEMFLPRSSPSPAYPVLDETPTGLNSDLDIAIPLPLLDETLTSLNSDLDIAIPLPLHKPSAPQALVHQSLGPQSDSDGPH
ncbi:hypothetical protein EV702DRAFT_1197593 [Suillus placidus]|uniref:Uncharacterized protein n=1 Tax=Suillus placidus TaxID=48579 RepID=A0A9P6ZW52_9AGAM|nr:hypothetical protein EV702DRAFT_1197593 [Suillus placidus]